MQFLGPYIARCSSKLHINNTYILEYFAVCSFTGKKSDRDLFLDVLISSFDRA